MIRTQGVTLIAGIAVWMLFARKWWQAAGFVAGFVLTTLPWAIRNRVVGLGPSRYLDQVLAVNIWQPDQGTATLSQLVDRGLKTLQMLITKAIPNTVTPYIKVDYGAASTFGEWVVGLMLIALILFGFWRMRRYFWFFTAYSAAVVGIICLWSAPSENRYITTLVPLLEIGLVVGVYALIEIGVRKWLSGKTAFSPLWLLVPAVMLASGRLKAVAEESKDGLPPQLAGFIDAAKAVRQQLPAQTVVCCRKPSVFYVYAQCYVCNFKYTKDDAELIRGLINSKVNFVVLDQLGYSATGLYLYPAIMKHQELFEGVAAFRMPQTYLLRFDRQAAELQFGTK